MNRRRTVTFVVGILLVAGAVPSAAAPRLSDVRGRLALGFAHVESSDSLSTPGGSLSIGAGLDLPVNDRLRAGIGVGYHLLGSRTLTQGSLTSGLDYSLFEALALLHWSPLDRGPELIVSGGPGLFVAKASLAATSVGAAFSPQAVDQTRVGGGLTVTVARRRPAPVRVGIELGVRVVPLEQFTWTLAAARLVLLY